MGQRVNDHLSHMHSYTHITGFTYGTFTRGRLVGTCPTGHNNCNSPFTSDGIPDNTVTPTTAGANSSSNRIPRGNDRGHDHSFTSKYMITFTFRWPTTLQTCPAGHGDCQNLWPVVLTLYDHLYTWNGTPYQEPHRVNDKLHRHPTTWVNAIIGTSTRNRMTFVSVVNCPLGHTDCRVDNWNVTAQGYANSITSVAGYSSWEAN